MRHAKRTDENQQAIVKALRDAGAYVWIISLPIDLLVGYKSQTFLVEIKRTAKSRFTPLQRDFFESWCGGTLARVDSPDAALRMIGVLK
ncbi:hypothetical protein UFOVP267_36 [uncultured Caudovirales phage]|uniref:VRR-NUC domain containing protein n=1 Tax=uncultured Caudovirales phage TaxID=2100421 RepID=A0A6J5LJ76_9CAUD|nr:hypothetical protein UFOVP267_36 [uncultured Caudovirales phage]